MSAHAIRHPERIKEANLRYHDVAATGYDTKWGIDFGPIGKAQVRAKVAKALGGWPDEGFGEALEIGSGTGYFSLNLMQLGLLGRVVATDISPGMLDELAASAERLGLEVETEVTDAERLPFADASFDLVFGHAVLHHLPGLPIALAEFRRVLRPGGTLVFCGEPSRYGDTIAGLPKRGAQLVAPLWRLLLGAPARRAEEAEHEDGHQLGARGRRARLCPGHARSALARGGLRGRQDPRRGAPGQPLRMDSPHARGERRPRAGSRTAGAGSRSAATSRSSASTLRCSSHDSRRPPSTTWCSRRAAARSAEGEGVPGDAGRELKRQHVAPDLRQVDEPVEALRRDARPSRRGRPRPASRIRNRVAVEQYTHLAGTAAASPSPGTRAAPGSSARGSHRSSAVADDAADLPAAAERPDRRGAGRVGAIAPKTWLAGPDRAVREAIGALCP